MLILKKRRSNHSNTLSALIIVNVLYLRCQLSPSIFIQIFSIQIRWRMSQTNWGLFSNSLSRTYWTVQILNVSESIQKNPSLDNLPVRVQFGAVIAVHWYLISGLFVIIICSIIEVIFILLLYNVIGLLFNLHFGVVIYSSGRKYGVANTGQKGR